MPPAAPARAAAGRRGRSLGRRDGPSRRDRGVDLPGLGVLAALAGAAQLLAPVRLGTVAVAAAAVWAVRASRFGGPTALGRAVPVLWAWLGGVVALGLAGPFAPVLAQPWALVALLAPFRLLRPGPEPPGWSASPPGARRAHDAAGWAAGLAPAAVLAAPLAAAGSLDRLVAVLAGDAGASAQVLLAQAVSRAGGFPVLAADPTDLAPRALLDVPAGPAQVVAALARTAGVDGGDGPGLVVAWAAAAAACYALLGTTAVWAFRRLVPAAARSWRADGAGLAVVGLALLVAPLPAAWASGAPSQALVLGAALAVLGVLADPRLRGLVPLGAAAGAAVVVAHAAPAVLPVVAAAWAVAAVRASRAVPGDRADVVVLAVLAVLACASAVPPVLARTVPWWSTPGQALGDPPDVLAPAVPVVAVLLALAAAALLVGRRALAAWPVPAGAAVLLVAALAADLVGAGAPGPATGRALLLLAAVLVPLAAAGAAVLAAGPAPARAARPAARTAGQAGGADAVAGPGRPAGAGAARAAALAAGAAVVAGAVAAQALVVPGPGLRTSAWPGPGFLTGLPAGTVAGPVDGARVAALAATGDGGAAVVAVDDLLPPGRVHPAARAAEDRWVWALAPTDLSTAFFAAASLPLVDSWRSLAHVAAGWVDANPGTRVVLVVGGADEEAALRAALGTSPGVAAVRADLPPRP